MLPNKYKNRVLNGGAIQALRSVLSRSRLNNVLNATAEAGGYSPLLDALGVTATGAWGLRQLRADYTGPGVRVRRDSDGAEQNIAIVDGVLDWADAAAFAGGANLFNRTWYDQSGNGNHLIQASAGNQPVLDIAQMEIRHTPGTFLAVMLDLSATNKATVFSVAKSTGATTGRLYELTGNGPIASFVDGIPGFYYGHQSGGAYYLKQVTPPVVTYQLASSYIDRSQVADDDRTSLWINGVEKTDTFLANGGIVGNFGNALFLVGLADGGGAPLTGAFKELVMVPNVDADRAAAEADINGFHSVY